MVSVLEHNITDLLEVNVVFTSPWGSQFIDQFLTSDTDVLGSNCCKLERIILRTVLFTFHAPKSGNNLPS